MPNLVYNTIKISGRKECVDKVMNRILVTKSYIKEIEKRNKGLDEDFQISTPAVGKLSFNRLIPKPTNIYCGELTNLEIMQYGEENCWRRWNRSHWGTKWDAYGQKISMPSDRELKMCFITAWDPPIYYLEKLSQVCVAEKCDMSGSFYDSFDEEGICFIDVDNGFCIDWPFDEEWVDQMENIRIPPECLKTLFQQVEEKKEKKTGTPSSWGDNIKISFGRDM